MKCKTCGQFITISQEAHQCPPAWNVTLHMRDAYRCGFEDTDRPEKTIYADTAEHAAAQYIEWFDKEHMDGDLADNDDHLWLYVRSAAAPEAQPLLIQASGCMEPQYSACVSLSPSDVPRCGWYKGCGKPALADDYLCAQHRAQEQAAELAHMEADRTAQYA